jgi:predicted metal-dependent HD superfamily phosphohydrolase
MDPAPIEGLRARWHRSLASFAAAVESADAAFADLVARYGEPGRHYHTLDHVAAVLDVVDTFGGTDPALQLAVWYHDAVYDTRAADNEERSADLARTALAALGVPESVIREAARLIVLTKTHRAAEDDANGRLLLDADLSVLGAEPAVYDRYAAAIRREYARVPEADYRAGRGRILEGFLTRPRIYYRLEHAEPAARSNLRREIDALGRK